MKILCLSKRTIPYMDGTSICVSMFLRALMAAGHNVRLVTGRSLPNEVDSPRLPEPGWEGVGCPTRHVDIEKRPRVGVWKTNASRVASLVSTYSLPYHEDVEWILAAEPVLLEEIEAFGPDVVVTTDPRGDHLAGLRARRLRKFVWVVSLDDPWDRRTMFEGVPWYSLSHLYHRRAISRIASKADAFVFPSKRLADFEKTFSFGPWPARVEIIPHLGTVSAKAAARDFDRFRLVHVGDLRPRGRAECQLPEGLKKAILSDPELLQKLEVVFVGHVPDQFRQRMQSCIGSAFKWVPPCAHPAALEYVASADVNVLIDRKCPVSILMETKLADYALVNAPIFALGSREGNMAYLAAEGECLHAPSDDAVEIADRILIFYRAWKDGTLRSYRHDKLAYMCQPAYGVRKFEALVRSIAATEEMRQRVF